MPSLSLKLSFPTLPFSHKHVAAHTYMDNFLVTQVCIHVHGDKQDGQHTAAGSTGRQASRHTRTARPSQHAVNRAHLALSSAKSKSIGGAQTESNSRKEGARSAQRLRTAATYSAILPVVAGACSDTRGTEVGSPTHSTESPRLLHHAF